jgi:hypothetical protein
MCAYFEKKSSKKKKQSTAVKSKTALCTKMIVFSNSHRVSHSGFILLFIDDVKSPRIIYFILFYFLYGISHLFYCK